MRNVLASLAAGALMLSVLPTAAAAAESEQLGIDYVHVSCDRLTGAAGIVWFDALVNLNAGSVAALSWASDGQPVGSQPIHGTAEAALSVDLSSLSATIDLYDPNTDPDPSFVGTAQVSLTLAPLGDPVRIFESSGKNSNHKRWIHGRDQHLAIGGQIQLPGGAAFGDLSTCEGSHERVTTFDNNPDSTVSREEVLFLSCAWTANGTSVLLHSFSDPYDHPADVSVMTPTAEYYGGTEDARLTVSAFSATVDIRPVASNDPGGSLSADASLALTNDRTRRRSGGPTSKSTVVSTALAIDGSVSLSMPGGGMTLEMNAETCVASSNRMQTIESTPEGSAGG